MTNLVPGTRYLSLLVSILAIIIRLTNQEGKVRFFSETFLIDKDLVHEYVKETIFTKSGLLKFYYDKKVIKIYNYEVNRH